MQLNRSTLPLARDYPANPGVLQHIGCLGVFGFVAQVWVAVESGSSEASACGDFVKGDRQAVENDCGAGVFDMLSAVGGHPVWA
jgi:hypothetical protein